MARSLRGFLEGGSVEDMEVNKEDNKEVMMEGWGKMEALQMGEEGRRLKEAQAQL